MRRWEAEALSLSLFPNFGPVCTTRGAIGANLRGESDLRPKRTFEVRFLSKSRASRLSFLVGIQASSIRLRMDLRAVPVDFPHR